jgi:serine/threonine protein kinase
MADQNICPRCRNALPVGSPRSICPKCLLKRGLEMDTAGYPGDPELASGWIPPAIDQLATSLPDLEIIELIGRGGMGAVYKAREKHLDRIVALKILPPEIGRDPAFATRFAREAQAMAKLNHPNIVAIHSFGQLGEFYFFIMEYVDGVSLRQLLGSGRLSPKEALAIVPQICEALQFAHDRGIVHRDIKPENILLNQAGQVKIADFGLAKLMGQPETNPAGPAAGGAGPAPNFPTEKVMGTPYYMAPEQAEHPGDVDHRADIYSLGVVFYQMLTGELPLGKFDPPSRKVVVDVRLDEVVLRAMEKEPARRYQQASEVKTEVETIAATGPQSSAQGARRPRRVSRLALAGVLGVATVIVAVGAWVLWHANQQQPMVTDPARANRYRPPRRTRGRPRP